MQIDLMEPDEPVDVTIRVLPEKAGIVREIARTRGAAYIETLTADSREVIFAFNLEDDSAREMLFALPPDVFAKIGVIEDSSITD